MPNFELPHTFHDNVDEVASGVAVDEDLEALKARIELLENAPTAPYTAHTPRAEKTPFTPNATHKTEVILAVHGTFGKASAITVKVGGVSVTGYNIGTVTESELLAFPLHFTVGAGESWEWEGASITAVTSSYRTI